MPEAGLGRRARGGSVQDPGRCGRHPSHDPSLRNASARSRSRLATIAGLLLRGQGVDACGLVDRQRPVVEGEDSPGVAQSLVAATKPSEQDAPPRQGLGGAGVMLQGGVEDLDRLLGLTKDLGEDARLVLQRMTIRGGERQRGVEIGKRSFGIRREPCQTTGDEACRVGGRQFQALLAVELRAPSGRQDVVAPALE